MSKITEVVNGQIICKSCLENKDVIMFETSNKKGYYRSVCKTCSGKSSRLLKIKVALDLFEQGLRLCFTCKKIKELSFFNKDKGNKLGYSCQCKECAYAHRKPIAKWVMIKHKYNITQEQYESKLKEQQNGCAICNKSLQEIDIRHVHVDHCHTTGITRGILCRDCNHGIGNFKDEIKLLEKAINYLKIYKL